MTRVANQFVDPTSVVPPYSWPINHDSMDATGRKRIITATAPTAGVGLVRQQGTDQPQVLVLHGTILTEAQRAAMISWWGLCLSHTIYFYEFSGEQWEVLITDFEETKVRVDQNLNDPTIPYHIYTYSLTMDVIQPISGPWSTLVLGAPFVGGALVGGRELFTITGDGSTSSFSPAYGTGNESVPATQSFPNVNVYDALGNEVIADVAVSGSGISVSFPDPPADGVQYTVAVTR